MKKISIILALIFASFGVNAQDKKLDKVKQLFENQNFQQCIEEAKKYNSSNSSRPDGYFYLGFSYFQLYKEDPKREYNLTTTENTVYQAVNKDKSGEISQKFSEKLSELKDTILSIQDRYYYAGDPKKAGPHAQMLAKIYKDTTEIYRRIYQPERYVKPLNAGKTLAAYEGEVNQKDVTGRKQGVWIEKFDNGKRKSQINYEHGKPRGDFYKFYPKGGIKAHLYFYDDSLASAIHYTEFGDKVAMGYYYNHKKDSLWQFFMSDSLLIAQEWYNRGLKDGLETTFSIFGFPAEEINWKNGKKDGIWRRYYESSQLMFETNYVNGELNGKYVKYDMQGNIIIQGNYKNDLKDGLWMITDTETKKIKKINYINGKPENDAELSEEETKMLKETEAEKFKHIPDPQDYRQNPEDYPLKH